MQALPGAILLPGYHGDLYLYDLERPWTGQDPQPNPRHLGRLGTGQGMANATDRSADGTVVIATRPDYGRKGGALTVFEESTLTWQTYQNLVPDQSMKAVCFGPGGLVYAGTSSLEVGPGEKGTTEPAHLLVFDPDSGAVVNDIIPVPEAAEVTALISLEDGRLLGGTSSGELFEYLPRTGITRTIRRFSHSISHLNWWEREQVILRNRLG